MIKQPLPAAIKKGPGEFRGLFLLPVLSRLKAGTIILRKIKDAARLAVGQPFNRIVYLAGMAGPAKPIQLREHANHPFGQLTLPHGL
jgi:hypothetical protein